MTNKQIIINGVDVNGCDFLAKKDDYCSYSGVTYAYKGQCMCSDEEMCKEHPKCFYKKVLKQLKRKEQECEELKDKNQYLINTCCHFKNEIKKYKKAVHKYKVVLQDKIKRLHLSHREFLKEINSVPVKIACKGENFKNALNNFNNAIQVINNEDNYKQALDKIERVWETDQDGDYDFMKFKILNIINKTKENN